MSDSGPLQWMHREGRNSEGERFSIHCLLHGSGRILAKVFAPVEAEEFIYATIFYCSVPRDILENSNETFHFVELEPAKKFAEEVLEQFDATAPPSLYAVVES